VIRVFIFETCTIIVRPALLKSQKISILIFNRQYPT